MVWARMTDGRLSNGSPIPMKTAVEHNVSSQDTAFVPIPEQILWQDLFA